MLGALAALLPAGASPARRRRRRQRRVLQRRQRRSQRLVSLGPDPGSRWPWAFLPLPLDSRGASMGHRVLGLFPLSVQRGPASWASGRRRGSVALPLVARGRGPGDRRTPGCAEPAWAARGDRGLSGVRGVSAVVRARTCCPPPAGAPPALVLYSGGRAGPGFGEGGKDPARTTSVSLASFGETRSCAPVWTKPPGTAPDFWWQGVVVLS